MRAGIFFTKWLAKNSESLLAISTQPFKLRFVGSSFKLAATCFQHVHVA